MKLSIRGRVLLLVLTSVLAAVLAVEAVVYYGYRMAEDAAMEQEQQMESLLAASMGEYAEMQAKRRIKELTEVRAKYIDRELAAAGYSAADLRKSVEKVAAEENGSCFVLDKNGNVIFSSEDKGVLAASTKISNELRDSEPSIAEAIRRMTEGQSGVMSVTLKEKVYYLAFAPLKSVSWSFGVVIEDAEVQMPVQRAVGKVREEMDSLGDILRQTAAECADEAGMALVPVLLLVFYASGYMAARLVRPIRRLSAGVREIAGGNFDKKLEIRTGDEIEHLADSFNTMTEELKKYMQNLARAAAEREHARTELEVAAQIQSDMLPSDFPAFPERKEFDLFALMHPAKDVGGDFYDFYLLDENHLVITIADVSGKGIPAALFMGMSQIVLKDCVRMAKEQGNLAAALENANRRLCENNDAAMFVTVFLGMLELSSGHFVYADGGHCPPLLGHEGSYEFLAMKKGVMLGLVEGPYEQQSIDLAPGDTLFLYTDGVSEAMDEQERPFTEPRIQEVLNDLPPEQGVEDMLSAVRETLKAHAGIAEQSDDITMLGLRYAGK